MSQPTYIASCSFGKDSIATILLALEHDEPLDRVVFSEVMFDHARNISGEIPEQRIEANARLLAAAPDLLAVLEIIVGIFEPNKLTPYRSARETVDLAKQIIGYVYGADERNRPTNESPSNDAEFLEWLYVRLVGTHGENPNTDFMQNLNSIIEKLR